jgi:hypothetical protein
MDATRELMDTLVELKGERSREKFDIMAPFMKLVLVEFEHQQIKFGEVTDRCIATETWKPLSNEQFISSSAIDIFAMVAQSVPMVLHSGLLLVQANIDTLVQNIESIVMRYGQFVVRSCGEKPPLSKKKDKHRTGGDVAVPEYKRQTIEELCVRANNLEFACNSIRDTANLVAAECELDKSADMPMANSIEVLESCIDRVVDYTGAKIVFSDLEAVLLRGLWAPTPAKSRVTDALNELDSAMSVLFEVIPNQDIFQNILRAIFICFVKVTKKVLTKGGKSRTYQSSDAPTFLEDFDAIEAWFIARDEEGQPQGLAVDEVEGHTLALHNLVESQEFAAGKDQDKS